RRARLRACRPRALGRPSALASLLDRSGVAGQLSLLDHAPGRLEGVLGIESVVEQDGADRAGDRAWATVDRERPGREQQPEALGEVGELGPVDVRGEHDELLPTPAEDEVARAQLAP